MPNAHVLVSVFAAATVAHCLAQRPVETPAQEVSVERILVEVVYAIEDAKTPQLAVPAIERLAAALGDSIEAKVALQVVTLCRTAESWNALDPRDCTSLLDLTVEARVPGRRHLLAPAVIALSRFRPDLPETRCLLAELYGYASPVFHVAKAVASLGDLRDMIPSSGDSSPERVAKLLGLGRILGDFGEGIEGARALLGYCDLFHNSLAGGRPFRELTPADWHVLQLLPQLRKAYQTGERMAALASLDAWGKEQPDNPAQILLLALAYASASDGEVKDRYHPDKAMTLIGKFLTLTDPKGKTPDAPWRLEEVRWVLTQFDVPCGNSRASMREHATKLLSTLKIGNTLPLLHMADFRALTRRVDIGSRKLKEKKENLEQLADRVVAAGGINPTPDRPRPGVYDQGGADHHESRSDAQRKLKTCQDNYDNAKKSCDDAGALLREYQNRLARYEQARKS
jgi:hypothetical protein